MADNNKMRVALYARVSTADQKCEMQLTAMREFASRQGWSIAGEYVDNGISGRKASRPELDRMLKDARQKRFDAVVCWKVDRVMRSVRHFSQLMADLDLWGIAFISITQPIDTRDKGMGRFITNILAAIAEYEADVIRERVCAGIANARARGAKLGRMAKLSEEEKEQVSQLRTNGLSYREIAKELGGRVSWMTIRRAMNG